MKKYRLGIDLGGTGIKTGVIDENNNIIFKHSAPTCTDKPFEEVVRDIADAAKTVAKEAGLTFEDFPIVGLGTPGFVDKQGNLVFSGNLGWTNVPFKTELEKYIPVPVYISNDANCAVVGEIIAGSGKGYKNAIMVTLGTGVGGGIVIDGRLYAGGDGMGTEIGHIPLVVGGEQCSCGAKGCFEAYASVTALIRDTKRAMESDPNSLLHEYAEKEGKVSGRTSFDCAKKGDKTALAVVDHYMEYVAAGIGGLISTFRPEAILIGGGLSNEGDYLLKPLNERVGKYVFAYKNIGASPIVKASLGNDAGIIGAAYLDRV